ncbi:MAG: hypothetical protein QXP21_06240 [Desulfurococcaceae archaeon]
MADEVYRVLAFGKKKIGKVHKRYVDIVRIYFGLPIGREKPFFEARVDKDTLRVVIEYFNAKYDDKGDYIVVYGNDVDEKIRRIVVYSGVRQTINSLLGRTLLEIIDSMGEVEILFWYSRFINAYDKGNYWDVYRVAKSFRTLYRL